ncbi:VIT domain-containing protein [Deinococcus roseus]|uniref:VIT domain-containing protein n=1 Tax=Deinococcus roseus TaxID=392414 RepID=A0ABQ2D108_9DEIO|nr:VIT domain-containing protein [Deinococcus roseus]GGJ33058.1 hypothetical protein GCM10008938_19150 [Deinococcus roseus]
MYKWLMLSASLLLMAQAPHVAAQSIVTRPALTVKTTPRETPVQLRAVTVNAEISGPFAQTEIELTFYNPNRRILEGELEFPLLEGQTVTGFALDFNGKWRDAVAIEKPRAQQVFEDVVRGNVDPALLQVTKGNNYKLRVYPLPAQGIRKVKLRITEHLNSAGGVYRLPLSYSALSRLRVNLNITNNDATLRTPEGLSELQDLELKPRGTSGQSLQFDEANFTGEGMLEVQLTGASETATFSQNLQGQRYFMAVVPRPQLTVPRIAPQSMEILWDSSLSGLKRDHDKELALLEGYFQKFPNLTVKLVRFRNVADAAETFEVKGGNWEDLREALLKTIYDGGTDFDALNAPPGASERLIFTDGLDNMTEAALAASSVPVDVVSSAVSSDPVRLKFLAQSGGKSINLTRLSKDQALQELLYGTVQLQKLTARGAKNLVVHEDPESWTIAGILTDNTAQLSYQLAGETQTLKVSSASPRSTQVAPLWASWTVEQLRGEERLNEAAIQRLGKQFNLVTPQTSLIVLDTVQDYVRYEIEPPAELQAEYQQLIQEQDNTVQTQKRNHQDMVLGLLQGYQDWWKKDFPKGDVPKPAEPQKSGEAEGEEGIAFDMAETNDTEMRLSRNEMPSPSVAAPASMAPSPEPVAADTAGGVPQPAGNQISIQLKKWTSDAPYIRRMQEAQARDLYAIYLDERPEYENSTAFFLDVADQLFEKKLPDLALRVLSNLSELELENRSILRIQAYRYLQAGYPELAIPLLEEVVKLAPYEPQSFRDLGLAYQQAHKDQKAIENLYRVVDQQWDGRFSEVELIALNELNAIVHASKTKLDTSFMDPRFLQDLPVDLRVVLTWDADNTDMDLWITDPNQERVYYGHRLSHQGGRISHDLTGGYGPEEFSLKTAKKGKYTIQADYYGSRQQILAGAVTLQAKLITHFGTPEQQEQLITLRLKDSNDNVFVGEFEVK